MEEATKMVAVAYNDDDEVSVGLCWVKLGLGWVMLG